ncbi:MAG: redoxin domain-containing protein [Planctomycetota bacterium]|nr:redoxin domain-containing protein [Planctomycetota bacterium]
MSQRLFRIVAVGLLSLCGIAWAMQGGPDTPAGDVQAPPAAGTSSALPGDKRAEQVLRAFDSFYRDLDRGDVKLTSALSMTQFGQEMTLDVDSTFSWRRPNHFAMRASDARMNGDEVPVGEYQGEVVCDGEQLYLHVPVLNSYLLREAPSSFDAMVEGDPEMTFLSASGGAELQVLIGVLSDDPYAQLTRTGTRLHYVGEETVDERDLHHLRVESEENVDVHLWIHRGEEPWLYRAKPDLQKFYDQMAASAGEAPGQPAPQLSFTFFDWSRQAPAEGVFAFKPPAGAEKTDTFYQEPEAPPRREPATKLVGEPAPEFTLPLLGGGTVDFAELKGEHIVILDFWATWCGPCRRALPLVAGVAEEFEDRGVRFYAVNIAEAEGRVRSFVQSNEYTFDIALDREGKVADRYKVSGIPQTVIIGRNGLVQAVHMGFLGDQTRPQMTKELETLLRGEDLFASAEHDEAGTINEASRGDTAGDR